MKKAKFFLPLIIFLCLAALAFLNWRQTNKPAGSTAPNLKDTVANQLQSPIASATPIDDVNVIASDQQAQVKISFAAANAPIFLVEITLEMTAFDALKAAAQKANLKIDAKSSNFGIIVNSIGQFSGGQDGKYWLYYVNGQMAQVAADKLKIKDGDQIEWKFENSTF